MPLKPHHFLIAMLFLLSFRAHGEPAGSGPPNILFIAVDDLRPELACYGASYIHSPNIDQLADEGVLFQNHFVNVPTCGSSRHCLVTGQLPTSPDHLRNDVTANTLSRSEETDVPESFIHHLRRNGYHTIGIGKITHSPDGRVYGYLEEKSDILELPYSWDEMLLNDGKWGTGHNAFFGYADGSNRNARDKEVKPYEAAKVGDKGYVDGLTAELAVRKLNELEERGKPFFLGVGFFKPHLPFNAPKKYWDLYDRSALPIAPFADIPTDASKASLHGSGELNQYRRGEEKASLEAPVSDAYARKLRHAYAASVSYIDAQWRKRKSRQRNRKHNGSLSHDIGSDRTQAGPQDRWKQPSWFLTRRGNRELAQYGLQLFQERRNFPAHGKVPIDPLHPGCRTADRIV